MEKPVGILQDVAILKATVSKLKAEHHEIQKDLKEARKKVQELEKKVLEAAGTTKSATSSAVLKPAPHNVPPLALRQGITFHARVDDDGDSLSIRDVNLLPYGVILLTDFDNMCIKTFTIQSQPLHTYKCKGKPLRLAVVSSDSTSKSTLVAATLLGCKTITILEVSAKCIRLKTVLTARRYYKAVAAIDKQTLAAGGDQEKGIDIITLEGQVLRQLTSSIIYRKMINTSDGSLLCITENNAMVKLDLTSGELLYRVIVPQLKHLGGIMEAQDGYLFVTDMTSRSLHLLTAQGVWIKQLWAVPGEPSTDDPLWGGSLRDGVCVCISDKGPVFVLDVIH